jgi:uncharacterized protein YacL
MKTFDKEVKWLLRSSGKIFKIVGIVLGWVLKLAGLLILIAIALALAAPILLVLVAVGLLIVLVAFVLVICGAVINFFNTAWQMISKSEQKRQEETDDEQASEIARA